MIAPDHDRRLELSVPHHLVEREAEQVPLLVTEPADPARQALEVNALPRCVQPSMQPFLLRKQLLGLGVGPVDVFRITGQRGPAEGSDALAEQRADVQRHEPLEIERVRDAGVLRHGADVVAVIEGRDSRLVEAEHCPYLSRHG